jgi:hypothetical protein
MSDGRRSIKHNILKSEREPVSPGGKTRIPCLRDTTKPQAFFEDNVADVILSNGRADKLKVVS